MWLLPSKGRPDAARQVLDECWQTGMRQPAILYVQDDPAGYGFKLPDNWFVVFGPENLRGSMQLIFKQYPDERCYGWLADDTHPTTPYWSYALEDLAYPWKLAYGQDHYISDMRAIDSNCLLTGTNFGTGMCWGGALVRCVGHWSPEFVIQAGIDWYWSMLVRNTPIAVYQHNVILKHDNYRTGRREKDSTDEWGSWVRDDIAKVKSHLKTKAFSELRARVQKGYIDYVAHGK